jgi:hypothetical protein
MFCSNNLVCLKPGLSRVESLLFHRKLSTMPPGIIFRALAVMHRLPCTGCQGLTAMHWLPCTGCHAPRLPFTSCQGLTAMYWLPCTGCHAPRLPHQGCNTSETTTEVVCVARRDATCFKMASYLFNLQMQQLKYA